MTKMHRREFAKITVAMAVLAPAACEPRALGQTTEAPQTKIKLTAKQEDDVKKAIERRTQQLALMRGRALPYDLEPAFVFTAWTRPRIQRKP